MGYMAPVANGTKGPGKRHSIQQWHNHQKWTSGHYSKETYPAQEFQREHANDYSQEQQRRGFKAKASQVPVSPSQQHQHHRHSTQHATAGQRKCKGNEKVYQAPGSPSHQQVEAVLPPPLPVDFPHRQGKLKHLMVMCSKCIDKGDACDASICQDYLKGQCEPAEDGKTCKHGLCHSCEGNMKVRNVPKPKFNKKISPAVQEHRTLKLMGAYGFVVKNCCYDEAGSMDEDRERRRAHSAAPDRSKDPFNRTHCHHCRNDEKQKEKRAQEVFHGRVLAMLTAGRPIIGPKLDIAWMDEDGKLDATQLLPESPEGTLPAYVLSTFRKQVTRDSGGIFDPLGLKPMCQKALCKHWIRGECKSTKETCKFAHCHAGSFETKHGNGVEEGVQGQLD